MVILKKIDDTYECHMEHGKGRYRFTEVNGDLVVSLIASPIISTRITVQPESANVIRIKPDES